MDDGSWNFAVLNQMLPPNCLQLLMSIMAPASDSGQDSIAWLHNSSGIFSVWIAYNCYKLKSTNNQRKIFAKIWKLEAPQRIRMFMWLVINNSLLTNHARMRKGMAHSNLCAICN